MLKYVPGLHFIRLYEITKIPLLTDKVGQSVRAALKQALSCRHADDC